jgi:hypothetical protein
MTTLLPSAAQQRSARNDFDSEVTANGWTVIVSGDLAERKLSNGQLAAIWRYSDGNGVDWYKLFTDRDMGDYVGVDFAMATAVTVETGVLA